MGLAPSSFYHKPGRSNNRVIFEEKLKDRIQKIAQEFSGYGQRRIYRQLRREGFQVNHKRVERLVRQMHLQCKRRRSFHATTNSKHSFLRHPNLIKGIIPERTNQIWVADITYIALREEWVYLSAILDLFSRKVIGYGLSTSLSSKFAIDSFKMAIRSRKPGPNCTHHSDCGIQYACNEYIGLLKEHNFRVSMSSIGNPYDNAAMESFFKTFKYEEVYMNDYQKLKDVIERVPYFIEQVYNAKRLHSSLKYVSPNEFETQLTGSCQFAHSPVQS